MDTSDSPANEVEPRKDPSGICATHDNNDPPEFEVGVSVFSKSSIEVIGLFLIVLLRTINSLIFDCIRCKLIYSVI